MKTVTIKNEWGETIELKRGPEGTIRIRHSGIHRKLFGRFQDVESRMRDIGFTHGEATKRGMDIESPEYKRVIEALGGVVVLHQKSHFLYDKDMVLIREAIKKLD